MAGSMSTPSSDAPFQPSAALSIVAAILFGVITCYHAFLFVKQKTWYLWWLLVAALMETAAYSMRTYYAQHRYPSELRKFLISYLLIIIAPFIIGISLFKTFSRLTWYTTPSHKRTFSTTWIPTGLFASPFKLVYLGAIIVSFIGAGGIVSYYSTPSSPAALSASETMLKAASVAFAITLGLFAIVTVHFIFISRAWSASALLSTDTPPMAWRRLLMLLPLLSILLILRATYYVFSFSTSTPSLKAFIVSHPELFLFTCDALPMLVVFVVLVIVHPGRCLPGPYVVFWFSARKVRKMEKKVLETQVWPPAGWRNDADVEGAGLRSRDGSGNGNWNAHGKQPVVAHSNLHWPADVHYSTRG